MEAIWREEPQVGFGGDVFYPYAARSIEAVGEKTTSQLKERIIESCPQVPGVYGMLDRKGTLVYVGKSKSLRSRLLSYFAQSNAREKGGRIIETARAIQWETQPSEFASLVREQQLIRRFSPQWNVQGQPKRQRPIYLCLGRQPATFFTAKIPPENVLSIKGPFFGAAKMSEVVDALNKLFKLRDCSQKQTFHFADQMQLFDLEHRPGCLRYEIGTCLGPCAAACSHPQYDAAVAAAESFMDGFNQEPLDEVRGQLERAVENRHYELASRHHATLEALGYVQRKMNRLARARRKYNFVYTVPGYDGCGIWYLIRGSEIVDVLAAPRNDQQKESVVETLQQWRRQESTAANEVSGPYPHTLPLVASWFRKHRDEVAESTLSIEQLLKLVSSGQRSALQVRAGND